MSDFIPISDPIKQQLLTQLCERFDDAIFILDANMRYLSVNAAYEIIIGYSEDFLIGRPLGIYDAEFLTEDERAILQDITTGLDENGFYENSFTMITRYGQTLNCYMTYHKICIDETRYHIGMIRDISSTIKDQQQLAHMQNFDQLTGLPNRKVFLTQMSDLLLDSYQEVVIVRVNIDRYRILNNNLGQDKLNILIKDFGNMSAMLL